MNPQEQHPDERGTFPRPLRSGKLAALVETLANRRRHGSTHENLLRVMRIAPHFGSARSPEAIAAAACREAAAVFGADVAFVVRRVDDDHVVLESREPASTLMPPGKTYVAAEILDVDHALRVPVTIHGETKRVLVLQWLDAQPVSAPETVLLAQRYADQVGLALEHAERLRAEEEAARNTRQTHRLLGVSAALAVAQTVADVATALVEEGLSQTGAESASVLMGEDASRSNEVVLTPTAASVPLTAGDAVVGAVELEFAEPREHDSTDREFLAAFGRQGGVALERARLHAEEVRAREAAELRASAAQALEFVAEGVFMVDHGGIVRVWNPATAEVTGVSDAVGRRIGDVVPGWDTFVERVPVGRAGERGALPLTLPLETVHGEAWISISGIRFDEGLVYAFRDVTDEHGLEQLKSDFIATISHELRTPLAVLYGGAATLGREDVVLSPDDRRTMLEMMVAEGQRLERLVDRILFASSLETDTAYYGSALVDAGELVRDVVGAMPRPIELTIAAECLVVGDRDHLRQIVSNLIENAIKYSPEGGTVHVTLERASDRLRIRIADEGRGVAHNERERIFDKFYRSDSQLATGVRGTGLGLYIVRELVKRMDGNVWVEPREDGGSLFVVELPAEAAL